MNHIHNKYVPCIRWKLGEYQALNHLPIEAKNLIVPLIEVAEIGFDFETRRNNKTVNEHLKNFAKRIKNKWGNKLCFIDIHHLDSSVRMEDGKHPLIYIFEDLRLNDIYAVPTIKLDPDDAFRKALRKVIEHDGRGICLRIDIEELARPSLASEIQILLKALEITIKECDLVLDMKAPNFEPIDGLVSLLNALIKNVPSLKDWRTFSLIGTSFPLSMAEVRMGPSIIRRNEWLFYKKLTKLFQASQIRIPNFGDYAINHPKVLHVDMRIVKPSASVRYTIDDGWLIVKGKNVRDHGYEQYRDLCKTVVESSHFAGYDFSLGDRYLYDCAHGSDGTGNLTTWRRVGTNHHFQKVVYDFSSHDVS